MCEYSIITTASAGFIAFLRPFYKYIIGITCLTMVLPNIAHAWGAIAHDRDTGAWGVQLDMKTKAEAEKVAFRNCNEHSEERKCAHWDVIPKAGLVAIATSPSAIGRGWNQNELDVAKHGALDSCAERTPTEETCKVVWTGEETVGGGNFPNSAKQIKKPTQKLSHRSRVESYRYHCTNGDCVRIFSDGQTERFQAPRCYDAIKGDWEWKPEGC